MERIQKSARKSEIRQNLEQLKMINEKGKITDKCKGDTVKDIIKIRLHMWDLKKNYRKEEEQPLYPLSAKEDDTRDHVLQCGRYEKKQQGNIKDNTEEEWQEIMQIFRGNKRKREERRKKVQDERQFTQKEEEQKVTLRVSKNTQVIAHTEISNKI